MKKAIIYTDGACKHNPGIGGYGIVIFIKDVNGNILKKEIKKAFSKTTNNKMELLSVIVALKEFNEPYEIDIYTDSKYVSDAINKNWVKEWKKQNFRIGKKDEVKNIDLWKELIDLLNFHSVNFIWVKGHNGNKYNERCDELANIAINEYIEGI